MMHPEEVKLEAVNQVTARAPVARYPHQMSPATIPSVEERQLLVQLGARLKLRRTDMGLTAAQAAQQAGISRSTLRSIEAGNPSTSMGAYLRVMSVLDVGGGLEIVARHDCPLAMPAANAALWHRSQDLLSLALHDHAVSLVKRDPQLRQRVLDTVERWLAKPDARSATLWREWVQIVQSGTWRQTLSRTQHAQQLRQASPLVTIVPDSERRKIVDQVHSLRRDATARREDERPS